MEAHNRRYYIEEVKCGESEGGIACGPAPGAVNASIKFSVDGESRWLTNSELDGIPNFFLTDKDVFRQLCEDDMSEEFSSYMEDSIITVFDGLYLGEYEDVFTSLAEDPENPAVPLVRYLILLTECGSDGIDELTEMGKGKYIDEVDIPVSDLEIKWYASLFDDGVEEEDE